MAKLKIKNEHLPSRCEICHQSDCFDPKNNYCTRCHSIYQHSNQSTNITNTTQNSLSGNGRDNLSSIVERIINYIPNILSSIILAAGIFICFGLAFRLFYEAFTIQYAFDTITIFCLSGMFCFWFAFFILLNSWLVYRYRMDQLNEWLLLPTFFSVSSQIVFLIGGYLLQSPTTILYGSITSLIVGLLVQFFVKTNNRLFISFEHKLNNCFDLLGKFYEHRIYPRRTLLIDITGWSVILSVSGYLIISSEINFINSILYLSFVVIIVKLLSEWINKK